MKNIALQPNSVINRNNSYEVLYARQENIEEWMSLAIRVQENFPGFEEESYRETVLRNMARKSALCVYAEGKMVGILLFSRKQGCLSYLAVAPEYRRKGIGSALVSKMLQEMDGIVWVDTFRANDTMGQAPRALYKQFGFAEGELMNDFGYPVQRFYRKGGGMAK